MSRGWPMRPSGLPVFAASMASGVHANVMSVSKAPGIAVLARTVGQVHARKTERQHVEAGLRHRVGEVARARSQ